MIQRIQSVYLLLVIIAYVLLFFFPIATYTTIDTAFSFSILEISGANSNSSFPLMGGVIILGLAVLVTIFLYKKRILQIKITAIILLAHIAFVAALFYVADVLSKKFGADAVYESGAYIALIPLVFLVLGKSCHS